MTAMASFPVRRQDFEFNEVPRHWVDNDPFMTAMFNALSSMFPNGERFFVDSVRGVRELVSDPVLQKEISAFIGQEAMHAKEHHAFNAGAIDQGFDVVRLEAWTANVLSIIRLPIFNNKRTRLAATVALEHFTGVLSANLLRREDISQTLSPKMQELWLWHCVEENEHKAVAFDVYQKVYGNSAANYLWRMTVMVIATALILGALHVFIAKLMAEDGQLSNLRSWGRGLWKFWGVGGMFTQLVPEYLDYFKPGFHPWDHDTKALLAKWKDRQGLNG